MPEIGEKNPLNPLYPVNPIRKPDRRDGPVRSEPKERNKESSTDEDDSEPHIDEYA